MVSVGSAIDCLRQSHRTLRTQLHDWSDATNSGYIVLAPIGVGRRYMTKNKGFSTAYRRIPGN